MKTAPQPRVITGRLVGASFGRYPTIVIEEPGEEEYGKEHFIGTRPHQVAGCRELLGKPCCARITEDEEGFTVLIDIWQEGEPAPWEKDPDGDAVMMEWWQLCRRMA